MKQKIKKYYLAIVVVLLLTQGVYSQSELKLKGDIGLLVKSDEEQISNIDKITEIIKANLNSYEKIEKFKDSTDFRYIYRKDKEVQIISIYSKDQNQNLSYLKELYFHNGQLIYAEQITTERKSNSVIDKEKMYFDNEQLFTWIQSGSKVDRNSDKFKKTAEELHDYTEELRIESMK